MPFALLPELLDGRSSSEPAVPAENREIAGLPLVARVHSLGNGSVIPARFCSWLPAALRKSQPGRARRGATARRVSHIFRPRLEAWFQCNVA